MKTFLNVAAQGDIMIRRVESIPKTAKKINPENGLYIVAHSETMHHHAIAECPQVELYQDAEDPLVAYLRVIEQTEQKEAKDGVTLEHHRPYDTHESLLIKGGTYEIRRQREHTPEGFRRVAD